MSTTSTPAPGSGPVVGPAAGRPGGGRRAVLGVPAALLTLAGSGYLVLMAGSGALPAAGFALLSAFYLLANTVGRGTFAALELELTRSVARARATGRDVAGPCRVVLGRGLVLLLGVLAVLALAVVPLERVLGGPGAVALLGAGAGGLAASSYVRGPLAGAGRYGGFVLSLLLEAGTCLAGAAVLRATGVDAPAAWMAVLALAPFVGVGGTLVVVPVAGLARRMTTARGGAGTGSFATLVWASLLFLGAQAVLNLGPVVASARHAADPATIAAFAGAAIVLRAPVMLFPAIQALLLPRLVHRAHGPSEPGAAGPSRARAVAAVAGLATVWMVGAVVLAPWLVPLLFVGEPVPRGVVALLAASVAAGTAAQFVQSELLAADRSAGVALVWLAGVVVLVGVALAPGVAPTTAAAAGQLLATLVVLVGLSVQAAPGRAGRRSR